MLLQYSFVFVPDESRPCVRLLVSTACAAIQGLEDPMKKLIAAFIALGMCTGIALADEAPPASYPTTEVAPEAPEATPDPVDCSTLEGEAKVACEEAAAVPAPEAAKAGKSLTKDEDGRMEDFANDE